jgi:hypothetical protein
VAVDEDGDALLVDTGAEVGRRGGVVDAGDDDLAGAVVDAVQFVRGTGSGLGTMLDDDVLRGLEAFGFADLDDS